MSSLQAWRLKPFPRSLMVFQHAMSIKNIMAPTETTITVIWDQASQP